MDGEKTSIKGKNRGRSSS